MNSTAAIRLTRSVLGNPVLSSLITLLVLAAGVMSGSNTLLIASSLLAFGRPFLYYAVLYPEARAEKPAKSGLDRSASLRTSTVGIR